MDCAYQRVAADVWWDNTGSFSTLIHSLGLLAAVLTCLWGGGVPLSSVQGLWLVFGDAMAGVGVRLDGFTARVLVPTAAIRRHSIISDLVTFDNIHLTSAVLNK